VKGKRVISRSSCVQPVDGPLPAISSWHPIFNEDKGIGLLQRSLWVLTKSENSKLNFQYESF
jgi:hypothetical protein